MFCDDHPQCLDTIPPIHQVRLNWRHQATTKNNVDLLSGARVLDVARHDGRGSIAALNA
jgi:hypothetical protein